MHRPGTGRRAAFTSTELTVVIVCLAVVAFFVLQPSGPTGKAKAGRINCVNNLKNVGLAWRIYATDNEDSYPWLRAHTNRPVCLTTNFATIPGNALPPSQGVAAILALVTNELSTLKILQCPDDRKRVRFKTNSIAFLMAPAQAAVRDRAVSYFIGLSAMEEAPQSILGGDRNLAGGPFTADTNTPPSQVALLIPNATATNMAAMNSAVWTKDIHQQAGNLLLGDGSVQQASNWRMREHFRDAALSTGADLDFVWPAN